MSTILDEASVALLDEAGSPICDEAGCTVLGPVAPLHPHIINRIAIVPVRIG